MAVKIQFRRDTAVNWQNANPVLSQGELGLDITNNRFKLGDGSTAWNDLDYTIDLAYDFQPDGTYANLRAQATTAGDVGLGNVDNESKATMFNNPTFTGDVSGITRDHVGLGNVNNEAQIPLTQKGVADGVATLDGSGLVPSDQLPSFVDDVVEGFFNVNNNLLYTDDQFTPGNEISGELGKIYVDTSTGNVYRYTGTVYVEISNPLDLASEAEAIAGNNDAKAMSPLRTKQAITDFHPDQNQVSDADNSANDNYIKSLTFDDYGHVTGVTSAEVSGGLDSFNVTIPTLGWQIESSGDWFGKYSKTVSLNGIEDTNRLLVDLDLTNATATNVNALINDFGLIFAFEALTNEIKIYANGLPREPLALNISVV